MTTPLRNPPLNPLHEVQEALLPSAWGSSPTFSTLPPRLGARELRASAQTAPVGFALLYPPYTWIPASAGMTERCWRRALCRVFPSCPSLAVSLVSNSLESPFAKGGPRGFGKLRLTRATHRGVLRGEAPLRSFLSPKNGGQRGLTARIQTGAAGFARALPALHVDSRLRGNGAASD